MKFHPDDVRTAFGVLCTHSPKSTDSVAGYRQLEMAWELACVALGAAVERRARHDEWLDSRELEYLRDAAEADLHSSDVEPMVDPPEGKE